ncbi:MAG: hypothetical protein ACRC92_12265 [Peptostreptococcaceae bacterium]
MTVKIRRLILAFIMLLNIIIILAGCTKESATQVVEEYFREVKQGTNEQVNEYLIDVAVNKSILDKTTEISLKSYEKFTDIICSKIEVDVIEEKENKNKATVKVKLKGDNISKIILDTFEENVASEFDGIEVDDKERINIMIDKAKISELETRTANINLNKIDGKWEIDSNKDMMDFIFGNE